MTLSLQAARRKEYPEMADDQRMVTDEVTKRPRATKVRVPITDIFYLTYLDPNTQKYVRQAISYDKKKTRLMPEDIRNFEAETNARPSLVQKELYFVRDENKGIWLDILGPKNHYSHYEDVTEDYYKLWRPDAYPKDSAFEDPFKGKQDVKPVDPMKFRGDMFERKLALMDAKEKGLTIPMATHVTPGVASMGEGMTTPMGEAHVEIKGKTAFQAGPSNINSGDPVGFIPQV